MNFDIKCSFSIPFLVKRETVEENFLVWSYDKHEIPLDLMCNAKLLKIEKIYFPVRHFYNIKYNAEWEAKSYWMHWESYTEYESKIVFLDHMGGEHDSKLGAEFISGARYDAQAVSKTVPVTKYKKVIDKVKQSTGTIKGTSYSTHMNYNPSRSSEFQEWTKKIRKGYSKGLEKFNDTDNCRVLDLEGTDEEAFALIKSRLYSEAKPLCEKQIPGDEYSDFSILKLEYNYDVKVILLPVFHVKYCYCDLEYDYYVNGTNIDDVFVEKFPVDDSFVKSKKQLTDKIEKEEKTENLYFLLALMGGILCLISGLGMAFLGIGLTLGIAALIDAVIFGVLYNKMKGEVQVLNQQLENLNKKRLNEKRSFCQEKNTGSFEELKECSDCKQELYVIDEKPSEEIVELDKTRNKKWYQKTGSIIALLILFFPVGLFLMWRYAKWKTIVKICVTAIFLLLII